MAGLERIGIFGGTFDPPHVGHLILASEACDQLSINRLLWVLTPNPPHKLGRSITPLASRLKMVQAAIECDDSFEISRIDIDRPPPHFAVDTVKLLRRAHPAAELIYLMGGDSLGDLPAWSRPADFLAACDALGVMRRPDEFVDLTLLEQTLPGVSAKVRFIDAPLLEISSTQIRRRAAEGHAFRYYLHPAVYGIIREDGLYRA